MADKNPNWAITNGNHRARGWEQTEAGNWVPSLHDRRRMVTSTMQMVAESNEGVVPGPVAMEIVQANTVGDEDFKAMVAKLNSYFAG